MSLIPAGLLAAIGGAAATTAYLDAKLHISKDLGVLSRMSQGEKNYANALKAKRASTYFLFEEAVQRHPNEPCIWSRQKEYTWAEAYERVCQYAHFFQDLGVEPFQYVGLYMYNCPEFIFIWLGLLSIGAAPALINYNLASGALVHCVKVASTKLLIYDAAPDCSSRVETSQQELRDIGTEPIVLSVALKERIAQYPKIRPETSCFDDPSKSPPFCLLYTSGTTGLPKAVALPMNRLYPGASVRTKVYGQKPCPGGDKSFYCIPLYHGTGGLSAMNDMFSGHSVALVPKFSLSRVWDDCIASKATIFVYVGELVRYLLSAPPSEKDRQHQIRLIWGNGLSPELWAKFQDRFGVPEIGEFYGSTEGILMLNNHTRSDWGHGAIGHHGWLLRRKFYDDLVPVQIDSETGDIWRSPKTGFAKRVPYEQGGEVLVKLPSRDAWPGYYKSKEGTNKKIIENVFETGDVFVRTGDSLRRDGNGHWFFMDRLGDTFRWKGENVSTTEVAQVFGSHPNLAEANVYGVKIPAHDGRAGCAAVALKDGQTPEAFDWAGLATLLRKELPSYAVPIFIRVRSGVGSMSTANHKHNKVPLREEGVDPDAMGTKVEDGKDDLLFWLPAGEPRYVPFAKADWERLTQLKARI